MWSHTLSAIQRRSLWRLSVTQRYVHQSWSLLRTRNQTQRQFAHAASCSRNNLFCLRRTSKLGFVGILTTPSHFSTSTTSTSQGDPVVKVGEGTKTQTQHVAGKASPLVSTETGIAYTSESSPSLSRLNSLSSFTTLASALCALNCTIMPFVIAVLPMAGAVISPCQFHALHEFSEKVITFGVIPIGSMTTALNYSQNKKPSIALLGGAGILSLLGAVAAPEWINVAAGSLDVSASTIKTAATLSGSSLLLSSSYLSRQAAKQAVVKKCCHT